MAELSDDGDDLERELTRLRAAHRSLDQRIQALSAEAATDQLELQRLKKRKLALKDRIARIESDRLPDIIA